jgi:hypothetical protein
MKPGTHCLTEDATTRLSHRRDIVPGCMFAPGVDTPELSLASCMTMITRLRCEYFSCPELTQESRPEGHLGSLYLPLTCYRELA